MIIKGVKAKHEEETAMKQCLYGTGNDTIIRNHIKFAMIPYLINTITIMQVYSKQRLKY